MGGNGLKRTDEDELCAIHLRNRLEGRPGDADAIRRLILAGSEVERFHDPARPFLHPEDVEIALDIDRYDFAVRVVFRGWATGRSYRSACGNDATVTDLAPIARGRSRAVVMDYVVAPFRQRRLMDSEWRGSCCGV